MVHWCSGVRLVLGLSGFAQAGKLQQQLAAESTLEQILKRGVMRVGMDTFVPWAMKDKTGKFVGFRDRCRQTSGRGYGCQS